MAIFTPWGYTLTTAQTLSEFLTVSEFNSFTNNKFTGDARIEPNIKSASRAIQNYCGWHIYPNLECEMIYNLRDFRDCIVNGADLLIQLPSRHVTGIKSVLLNPIKTGDVWTGDEVTDYDLDPTGLLRIFDIGLHDRRTKIRLLFDSGFSSSDEMDVLKELTAHRVTHAVSSSYGVNSETVGGVSVSYNASWAGNTRSSALPDDNKEVLATYKVKGVY